MKKESNIKMLAEFVKNDMKWDSSKNTKNKNNNLQIRNKITKISYFSRISQNKKIICIFSLLQDSLKNT